MSLVPYVIEQTSRGERFIRHLLKTFKRQNHFSGR